MERGRGVALLMLMSGLVACDGQPDDFTPGDDDTSDDDDASDDDDTVECTEIQVGSDAPITALTSELAAGISTAIVVEYDTVAGASSRVRFGPDADYEWATVLDPDGQTAHRTILVGVPALTDMHYRVEIEVDGDLFCTEDHIRTTGSLPSELPYLAASQVDPAKSAGGFTLTPVATPFEDTWITIFDAEGQVAWTYNSGPAMVTRALPLPGRQALVINGQASGQNSSTNLRIVQYDGTVVQIPVQGIHTDMALVDEHTVAVLGWDLREFEGGTRKILGDTIVEVDLDTGATETVWYILDDIDPDLSQTYSTGWYLEDPDAESWSHVNGLSFDPVRGDYLVTSAGLQSVLSIARDSGELNWVLGGPEDDFGLPDPSWMISSPHGVEALGDDLLVFNRNGLGQECSEAARVELDRDQMTATEVWFHESEDCLGVYFLGNAEPLPGGNVLITWSSSGQIDEVTPDGAVVWRVNTDVGGGVAFGNRVESLYE